MSALGKAVPGRKIIREIDQEWEEFVQKNAFRDDDGELVWGDALIRAMGEVGLKGLYYLARRGHFESCRILKETFLGLPEQPMAVRLQETSAQETHTILMQFLQVNTGMSTELSEKFLERFRQSALQEPLPALPEPKPAKRVRKVPREQVDGAGR